jgi:hypothetical protein
MMEKRCSGAFPAVAFDDAHEAFAQARYSLAEALGHRIWFRQRKTPPDPMSGRWFESYYLSDAAMRLYAAGEHLARAIVYMLDLKDSELGRYRGKRASAQSAVARYLHRERPGHELTAAVDSLHRIAEWRKTLVYRGRVVHAQPPLVEGLGIGFERRRRWQPEPEGGWMLGVGGGDKPECTTDELFDCVSTAAHAFQVTLIVSAKHYWALLARYGIWLNAESKSMHVQLFAPLPGDSSDEPSAGTESSK